MTGEGLDMNQGVCVHLLTLTRPRAMSKDIALGIRRVGALHISAGDRKLVPAQCVRPDAEREQRHMH